MLQQLLSITARLGHDEMRVLLSVAEGLARGRTVYGDLNVATDLRDFRAEAHEELRDALIYLTAAVLRGA